MRRPSLLVVAVAIAGASGSGPLLRAQATSTAAAPPPILLQATDLVYAGAFRVPVVPSDASLKDFDDSGRALTYVPATNSLLIMADAGANIPNPDSSPGLAVSYIADITIPEVRIAASIGELAMAKLRQPFTDILKGRQPYIDPKYPTDAMNPHVGPIGGLLPLANGTLIVSAYISYDAGYEQTKSHFRSGLDFANLPAVSGPFEVSAGGSWGGSAGFVSGYMTPIPGEWQAALGGTAVTGNCCISIITRTSWGPGLSSFNPADIGVVAPVPAHVLIRYSADHPTLGTADSNNTLFNGGDAMGGVIFPAGTRSVLFFGRHGNQHCYGQGTNDASLHGKRVPGEGDVYCYDPALGGKGEHAYPYDQFVWAYDVNDLIAVKNGRKQHWQVVPYATWSFHVPFEYSGRTIKGVTYDPATRRIFMTTQWNDGARPLVHVFALSGGPGEPRALSKADSAR